MLALASWLHHTFSSSESRNPEKRNIANLNPGGELQTRTIPTYLLRILYVFFTKSTVKNNKTRIQRDWAESGNMKQTGGLVELKSHNRKY